MKLLTDSYYKEEEGFIRLSGKSEGARALLEEKIAEFEGGDKTVFFHNITDEAKALVEESFGATYTDSEESYVIDINKNGVNIYADGERARTFAAYSLLARREKDGLRISKIYSTPTVEHRSIRVFFPPKSELEFFKSYLDTIVELGYNTLILEIGGAMQFESHPEISETWKAYCDSMKEFNEKVYTAQDSYKRVKNSIHTFNADGDIYSKDEARLIAKWCKERCIELIPEVPSLSHSEYILISHPELRECDDEDFASTACPQNEELYKLVFDLFDEVINVFEPKTMHIGHDEWWVMCVCDKCRGKNASELFAYNVKRLYDYLGAKGIKTMLWADKLKAVTDKNGESHGAARKEIYALPTKRRVDVMGKEYTINEMHWFKPSKEAVENGFLHVIENTEDTINLLPNDIICLNWYHSIDPELNDIFLRKGFPMIYGNCNPACLPCAKKRFSFGARGFSVSSWTVTREHDLQLWQGFFYEIGYGALLAWDHNHSEFDYSENAEQVRRQLFRRRNEKTASAPHLAVRHRLVKKYDPLEKYFTGVLPYCEDDKLTLGHYVVKYASGKEEKFPVLYAVNASFANAKDSRIESPSSWYYATDSHLDKVVPSALPVKESDGFVYECIFPTDTDALECTFVPKEGYEGAVEVVSVELVK